MMDSLTAVLYFHHETHSSYWMFRPEINLHNNELDKVVDKLFVVVGEKSFTCINRRMLFPLIGWVAVIVSFLRYMFSRTQFSTIIRVDVADPEQMASLVMEKDNENGRSPSFVHRFFVKLTSNGINYFLSADDNNSDCVPYDGNSHIGS